MINGNIFLINGVLSRAFLSWTDDLGEAVKAVNQWVITPKMNVTGGKPLPIMSSNNKFRVFLHPSIDWDSATVENLGSNFELVCNDTAVFEHVKYPGVRILLSKNHSFATDLSSELEFRQECKALEEQLNQAQTMAQ